jgi:hypothetical protein
MRATSTAHVFGYWEIIQGIIYEAICAYRFYIF